MDKGRPAGNVNTDDEFCDLQVEDFATMDLQMSVGESKLSEDNLVEDIQKVCDFCNTV